ncbi:hypothetical protein Fmac_003828 [Flemingia macrophylla]|uniref:RNA methyltransferase n=1 Tax=Flemingia macrophylla TaxID=520843 RepID=A0ABD1N4I1_9FABA
MNCCYNILSHLLTDCLSHNATKNRPPMKAKAFKPEVKIEGFCVEREGMESQKQKQKQKQQSKKQKQVFPYGNYKSYYGYRIGQGVDEDPRLKVFRKEWFQGRDCLDVGCNNGMITIQIDRVQDAYWNLRKTVRLASTGNKHVKSSKLQDKDHADDSGNSLSSVDTKGVSKEHSSGKIDLSNVVSFKRENFVQSRHPPGNHYDTILCLSVSKWIHLNWGDDGLITLFAEAWKLLRPGGVFILEPQPWKSYESNRNVTERVGRRRGVAGMQPEHDRSGRR